MSKFIGYLPVGFPDFDTSVQGFKTLIDAGADVLEVGIPYSDPVMDGATIQDATLKSIRGGFHIAQTFDLITQIQEYIELKMRSGQIHRRVEVYIMSYYNVLLKFGLSDFVDASFECGVAGLIIPDLIPDESGPLQKLLKNKSIKQVFLSAPNSTDERLDVVTASTSGFLYASSLLGTTGVREDGDQFDGVPALIDNIRKSQVRTMNYTPIYLGLGVSNAYQASRVAEHVDGVIVGSKLVQALESGLSQLFIIAKELSDAVH